MEQSPHTESSLDKSISPEVPSYVDVGTLMKEKNCYFVHMIQVTNALNVSENNKAIDTNNLDVGDKLDILYAASPTLSVSSLRPHTEDGTFAGGFGVLFSQGEIISASPSDNGTIATSLQHREVIGGVRNGEEDIDIAINRPQYGKGKTYNEMVLKSPEIIGGFMKLDDYGDRITYEEEEIDYGRGGGIEKKKVGVLNMANEKDRYGNVQKNYDRPFAVLLEMQARGPVFVMDEANQLYTVKKIDTEKRVVEFVTTPMTPRDMSEVYGESGMNKYTKEEIRNKLTAKGVVLH